MWGLPLVVTLLWIAWGLHQVDALEASMGSRSGLSYSVFVQLSHSWNQGWGWHQTVHPNYLSVWHWGWHYGVIWFATAKLAGLWDSAWALMRIQIVWVGLGCPSAALLGWWEGRRAGSLVGLMFYAASGSVLFIAADDYQDLTFCLPLIPLAIWAARHAPAWLFLLCGTLLCSVREELWPLVPLVGLTRSWQRAGLGALLALGWCGLMHQLTPIAFETPPLQRVLAMGAETPLLARFGAMDWSETIAACGGALPWLLLQPASALAVVGTALVHGMPEMGSLTRGWVFSHHFAPVAGFAVAGATVVLARLARWGRAGAALALVMALSSTAVSWGDWRPRLALASPPGSDAPHPAWPLLERVPQDAVLYLPSPLCPAAARRRWLANEQSLGFRIEAADVTHAVVPSGCGVPGTVIAEADGWVLLAEPSGLPQRGERPPWDLFGAVVVGGCGS